MPTVWQLLESIPGPAAVPAVWMASLGAEFDAFRDAFLRQLPAPAKSYPCPKECGCAHEVVKHRDGKIVAVCRCDPCRCDDIQLRDSDILVLELNWSALGRAVAAALGVAAREADIGVRGALQIAVSGSDALPVVLVIRNDRDSFRQAVDALVARLRGRFMVIAPTVDFVDGTVQQSLSGVDARVVSLDASVRVSGTGTLIAAEAANGSGIGATTGWEGLRIGEIFEPRTMQWNGKPFLIEEPAICYKGYDLENQSLEDYYPDLREDWDLHIKDVPFDEVENLRILRLVGGEKTLLIHVMIRESVPVYPERFESSGETDGWHEGGVVVVDGQRVEAKGVHVEPTDPKVRAKIEAARRSRAALPSAERRNTPGAPPKRAGKHPRTVRTGKTASRSLFDWVRQAELVRALDRVLGEAESPDKATLTRAVQKGQIQSNGESGRKLLLQVDSVKAWLTRTRGMDHAEVQQVVDAIIAEIRMRPQKH